MLTVAQRRRRARWLKTGAAVALFALVLTPRLDNFELPQFGIPLISTAVAAPLDPG